MKNIMAVTACLKRCSVAILYDNIVYEINEDSDAATNLVYLADKLIKLNNINLKNIHCIITTSGPGSFTGIRTAQSFAKGIALSLKIESSCVDFFDVINSIYSENYRNDYSNRLIVIKSDKHCIYFKKILFTNDKVQLCESGVTDLCDLYRQINFEEDCVIIGDAVDETREHICNEHYTTRIRFQYIDDFKKARHLLKFAEKTNHPGIIKPLYINASV